MKDKPYDMSPMTKLEDLRKEWESRLTVVDELREDENKQIVVLHDEHDNFYVYTYMRFTGGNAPTWDLRIDARCVSPSAAFKALFWRLR